MRKAPIALLVLGASLVLVPSAAAATRFAAPGGTGANPCASPADPCSIFRAADANGGAALGDEVVLAPGEYSDTAGDLGPGGIVSLKPGISVHGAGGGPRPVIRLDGAGVGLIVEAGDTVSHLEIDSAASEHNIVILGGTVDDLIARSSAEEAEVCILLGGVISNSACLSSGKESTALGGNLFPADGARTVRLRNVTARATGADSKGLAYRLISTGAAPTLDVFAKSVIAEGTTSDVFAAGLSQPPHLPGTGGDIRIQLDHSDYATRDTRIDAGEGSAEVTAPGAPTNIIAPPVLAADGYHQLAGSPTIDAGAIDEFSGGSDIDGQPRTLGAGPDIGADEFVPPPQSPAVQPPSAGPPAGGGAPANRPAPITRIGRHPSKRTSTRTAIFSFTANQAGATFECKLDGRPFKRCSPPYRTTVKPGRHTFRVRAVRSGTADPTPAIFSWVVS